MSEMLWVATSAYFLSAGRSREDCGAATAPTHGRIHDEHDHYARWHEHLL